MGVTPGKTVGEGWANQWQLLKPQDVADAVLYAASAPPHVAVNEILIEPRDQS
jgi:NADP-dependent 3-hydroxy acid dehydrogenase YdfG